MSNALRKIKIFQYLNFEEKTRLLFDPNPITMSKKLPRYINLIMETQVHIFLI